MAEKTNVKVAVIGLGSCGLGALKNLREAGFDATGYEENDYVGGLWQHTDVPNKTSVLKTTIANLSKQMACYTDFPYRDDVPDFATAAQTLQYLQDYAKHFGLMEHARLGMKLMNISRDGDGWAVKMIHNSSKEEEIVRVDKIVLSVGLQVQAPKVPKIKGIETFTGKWMHSNDYKEPSSFDGKRVVVVGLGNTGCDTCVDLIGHASDIWLSHRRGTAIISRWNKKGKPAGNLLTLRLTMLGGLFNKYFPNLSIKATILGFKKLQKDSFAIKPEWGLGTVELPSRKVPIANETFIPALHEEKIILKPGLKEVNGSTLTFSDGSTLADIDAIIFATGFRSDYSYMASSVDPTRNSRKDWSSLPGADGRPLPRLYQGIFSLDHPDSLAFLGTSPFSPMACLNYDICSAAVAQVWAGNSTLPPLSEMNQHIDAQHEYVCSIARTGGLANVNLRNNWDWFKWCDETAGIGLVKRMGFKTESWRLWWNDRKLSKLVTDGLLTPHLFRLFDEGKRKPWDGAREAIVKVNEEANA